MLILRTGLFSKKKILSTGNIGAALLLGGLGLNVAALKSMKNAKNDPELKKENEELLKKLRERAEKDNILLEEKPGKKKKSDGQNYFIEISSSERKKKKYDKKYKGRIRLDSGSASTLSHELGHGEYSLDIAKGAGGKIGKFMHKAAVPSRVLDHPAFFLPARLGNAYHGACAGRSSKRKELEGEKDNMLNKHRAWALPAIIDAPKVISEGMASAKGYKMLKDAGASKKYLKHTKKDLTKAGLTYLGSAMMNSGVGLLGKASGEQDAEQDHMWKKSREDRMRELDAHREQFLQRQREMDAVREQFRQRRRN